jgi:hypothetical protein
MEYSGQRDYLPAIVLERDPQRDLETLVYDDLRRMLNHLTANVTMESRNLQAGAGLDRPWEVETYACCGNTASLNLTDMHKSL